MSKLHVVFFGAHPDDETVMFGGTLAALAAHGVHTTVVCATDGRGGEHGDVAEAATPSALARVREAELRCAVRALGVHELILLGYQDPPVGPNNELYAFAQDEDALVEQIAELLKKTRADVALTHGSDGEYGHPAHIQAHRAVARAVRQHAPHVLFYTVAAYVPQFPDHLWNAHDMAHLALEITPWFEQKHAAMLCHRTQHQLFLRHRKLQNVRQAVRTLESVRRHHPPLAPGKPPQDPFAQTLLELGAWRPQVREGA